MTVSICSALCEEKDVKQYKISDSLTHSLRNKYLCIDSANAFPYYLSLFLFTGIFGTIQPYKVTVTKIC